MKFVFIFVALIFANLHFCQAHNQNSNKPFAHIETADREVVTYQAYQVIRDWDVHAPHSRLSGGMTYRNGELTVPTTGRYYIYLQVFYRSNGRIFVNVNNNRVTMIQAPWTGRRQDQQGTVYAGGVFNLNAYDRIKFTSAFSDFKIYMGSYHTYFGAYLL